MIYFKSTIQRMINESIGDAMYDLTSIEALRWQKSVELARRIVEGGDTKSLALEILAEHRQDVQAARKAFLERKIERNLDI